MSNLLENMNAPVFTVDIDGGSKLDTSNIKNAYILYFYPKDDTPGCTKEAIEFSENSSYFKVNNITVIGISKDTVVKHDKFKLKHDLKIILGSDITGVICEKFGVWVEKSMYGKKYMGIQRSTFLSNDKGIIVNIWEKVKVPGHAEEVLETLKKINN